MRNLVLVLGDQLDAQSSAFDDFDRDQDAVWMAEARQETTHVWCHKLRIAFFFTAMRKFRDRLRGDGLQVLYHQLLDGQGETFAEILAATVQEHEPQKLIVVEPGDHRVREALSDASESAEVPLEIRTDRHFYSTREEFAEWADGRKRIVLEDFYRLLRKRHNVLIDEDGKPVGGDWNFDQSNRESFGKSGPDSLPTPPTFEPGDAGDEVMQMVEQQFPDHPGSLDHFDLPTDRDQALAYLDDFIGNRLPDFGRYQDAMWGDEPFLYHSRLSPLLNVKLLHPRECVERAVAAYESGAAPIESVEGFVRQILGWREFVRGVYWHWMPEYIERNALECDDRDVPQSYWDGETEMRCVSAAMKNVLDHGYAHHIQRLMVLGLFAQLLGVHPRRFHDWHMAMYLDAIDWVSLPNTLGMSQFGDGGIVGTKPYCASGAYINRMSNYCSDCRFNPKKSTGDDACPVTTLYWDFLDRHRESFAKNRRMVFQIRNLERKSDDELDRIRKQAEKVRESVTAS